LNKQHEEQTIFLAYLKEERDLKYEDFFLVLLILLNVVKHILKPKDVILFIYFSVRFFDETQK